MFQISVFNLITSVNAGWDELDLMELDRTRSLTPPMHSADRSTASVCLSAVP